MTSNEAPAGNASRLIAQKFEGESGRRREKSERGSNRGNLLYVWEDNTSENQKSYNSSKFEKKKNPGESSPRDKKQNWSRNFREPKGVPLFTQI
jgi:hypothetical protein